MRLYVGVIPMSDRDLKICPYRVVEPFRPCTSYCPWCVPNDRGCGLMDELSNSVLPKIRLTNAEKRILYHLLLHGSSNVYSIYRYYCQNEDLPGFSQGTVHHAMKTLEEKNLVFHEDSIEGQTKQIRKMFGLTISGFRYAKNHHFEVLRREADPYA